MNQATPLQDAASKSQLMSNIAHSGLLLQRKCSCGGATSSLSGECEACKKKRLQKKLSIGVNNDPLEQEADRVADQVMAMSPKSGVSRTPPRIQRASGQAAADAGTAPASVDRVLAGSGRPLEPALQQDMGQRFGHDFSQVRVHTGTEAEQSAQDANAHAYTLGWNIVLGAGQFSPRSRAGQKLLAHELVHVVQQQGMGSHRRILRSPAKPHTGPCKPDIGNCDYYDCREKSHPCGSKGYYLGYGGKYCRRFNTATKPKLSSSGKVWVDKTTICLQKYLEKKVPYGTPCDDARSKAFASHSDCYVDSGLCELPFYDLYHIFNTVDRSDLIRSGKMQAVITGSICLAKWAGSAVGTKGPDGSITYPDGTTIHPDGRTTLGPGPKW